MADSFDQTIYKLSIDDSGYIRGVDSMSESTKRFVEIQAEANKRLQGNEAALKSSSDFIIKAKKDLDSYTGSNETYRKQLEKTFQSAQADNIKLTSIVAESRKAYEAATKAAQDFASTSQRAANLQPTPGARIPTAVPLGIQQPVTDMFKDLSGLPDIVAESTNEFDQLRVALALVEERMLGLDAASDEFKALAPIVEQGRKALQDYDNVVKVSATGTKSFRQEIADANLELKRLEEQGKGNSQEFINQEKKVAQLTDAYEKQRARIKVLASDTRALDFGKAGIQAAISGFQAYASLSILVGNANEDLQKKTLQLFAAMQLLSSLEQLNTLVKRGSVIATNLQSASLVVYKAVVDASSSALGKFKLALAATGIGLAVIAVGFLVKKFQELGQANDEAARKQKILNDVIKESAGEYVKAYTEVSRLKDQFELASKGIGSQRDALIEYNKTLGSTVGFATDFKDAEEKLMNNASAYIRITQLKAEANLLLAKSAEANLALDQALAANIDKTLPKFQQEALKKLKERLIADAKESVKDVNDLFVTVTNKIQTETVKVSGKTTQQLLAETLPKSGTIGATKKRIEGEIDDLKTAFDKLSETNAAGREQNLADQKKLQDQLDKLGGKVPAAKGKSAVENIFEQERAQLEAALKELRNKEAATITKINEEFAAKLETDRLKIQKEIKDKKILGDLTKPLEQQPTTQAGILFSIQVKINEEQKQQAIDKLNKEITDARQKLNDDLKALQEKNLQDSINLIQDDFDRRAQLIAANEEKELQLAKDNQAKQLAALDEVPLLPLRDFQDAKAAIVQAGEDQQTNIVLKAARDRQALALDIFKQSLDALQNIANQVDTGVGQLVAQRIQALSARFLAGKISFQRFQADLKKIQDKADSDSRSRQLQADKDSLAALNLRIAETIDRKTDQYNELLRLKADFEAKIAKETKDNAVATVTTSQGATSERTQQILDYASAIGSVADSAIQFWQKANEAESRALDRSISLQEKRVDAAQRIAERGNAQYLKTESDKLKQLQVARENAARRDLAINAALQGSQILVGITGAIAKLAGGPLGAAAVVGEIAVIIAALATGYALVKSLQGNQPQFKEGTKRVRRDRGEPAGTDTVQAWLNEDEAVIPAHRNKAYHPTVEAIYDGKIPPEVINRYVNNYVNNRTEVVNKSSGHVDNATYRNYIESATYKNFISTQMVKAVPQVNYQRIKESAELHISHDSKLVGLLTEQNRKLDENNDLQRKILKKSIVIEQKIDRNGVAQSVTEYMDQERKNKKL